jgi:hypothetical protein
MEASKIIKQAIHNMGGATRAGILLQVSTNTIHKWVRNGVIPRLDKAVQVSDASGFDLALLRPRFDPSASQH